MNQILFDPERASAVEIVKAGLQDPGISLQTKTRSMEIKPTQKDAKYMDKWTRRSAITHGISDERLMEICHAERSGQCVALKCKIGDVVYAVGRKKIVKLEIRNVFIDNMLDIEYLAWFECDKCCDGCPLDSWAQSWDGEWSCDGEYGETTINQSAFGKTVFITSEEAAAALKKMLEENLE